MNVSNEPTKAAWTGAAKDPVLQPGSESADAAASTDAYARRFSGKVGAWMLSVQSSILLALLADVAKGTVLDVGGGHAQVTPMLRDAGYHASTIVSDVASTQRLDLAGVPQQAVTIGNLMSMPFADRSFDAVVSVRMMAHVQDVPAYLAELCRVARQAIVIDYTCSHGVGRIGTWFYGAKRLLEGDTRRYTISNRSEIAWLLESNGFAIDRHVGQFALPLVLHRKMRSARASRALETLLRPVARRLGNPVLLRATRRKDTA